MPKAQKVEKPKHFKKTLKILVSSLKKYGWAILAAVILSIGAAVVGIFIPRILGDMTNIAVSTYPEIDFGAIAGKVWLTVGLLLMAGVLSYIEGVILTIVSARWTENLRNQIIDKINRLPISYFDKHKYGDTLSLMTNDVDVLATSLSQQITNLTSHIATLIGVVVMMLTISVPLSLVAFITLPISLVVIGKITKFAQKYFVERQKILGELDGRIEEDYSGELVIKANSYEQTAIETFNDVNNELARAAGKAQFYSTLSFPATHIITNLIYVAVAALGGVFVVEGKITIGGIQAFIQYVSSFNHPITEIAQTMSTMQGMFASAERVFDFLAEEEEEADPESSLVIEKMRGAVEFHDVCFSYDKKTPVIKNFSAKIEPGMQVAIVGPTGAGKTTMINLLMRFYEPDSGYITIDGVPIREMKRADVRKMFGMVLQDTWLFSGTVEENLRYGRHAATLEDIKKASRASNAYHVIEALPKAYKAEISEDSDNISAGEKQLITIARAMVAEPPMMILDEATSNVDTRTEQLIQESFEKLTKKRTSFVIAHRLSTIRNSDLILVMKDGNIVEQGNHNELLKLNGFYAELYNSQFAG
ncbi:MAG: ABC transporter ATP-binding protein [Candidatus Saccharibacteria bacterium]|nr:ABC transporter ATP-binding protein [Candidatus Saccharibacteria bacterium]